MPQYVDVDEDVGTDLVVALTLNLPIGGTLGRVSLVSSFGVVAEQADGRAALWSLDDDGGASRLLELRQGAEVTTWVEGREVARYFVAESLADGQ
ncbi:hypothetical protein EV385_4550 [Krasilnikovia cinnamomea]|uniref:Uncharacterized protein n=1 Tax=Krasilnikovia cinnamomea TaxID=349313 RepID=A0A4Q7ZNQ3_9ACTN|nr:hypothetical protein [Krasilnikovia cinnamomea]RZU52672.1 hypothetical protein EV385_4550 [Krasilnikovia cinnamomea]